MITDLTRMYRGMVCVAGYDKEHHCVRPVLPPPGIPEHSLVVGGKPIVFPFALVELDLTEATPDPPHVEDFRFNAESLAFIRLVTDREAVLRWSLFDTVNLIFEGAVRDDHGFYVPEGQGKRSLGTVQPRSIVEVKYEPERHGEAWDYRIHFYDADKERHQPYRLKITDLTWHYYCDSLREQGQEREQIALSLTNMLRSRKVYLRIGLSRGWAEFPDRCYLQVNGIHTFPDYLEGKAFTDFGPRV